MNPSHALLKSVRIPGNIVVKQDMAALQVDSFACCFRGSQNLSFQIPKVSLGIYPSAFFIAASRLHPAVNLSNRQPPLLKLANEIIQGVFVFRED